MASVTVEVITFNYFPKGGPMRYNRDRFGMEETEARNNPSVRIVDPAAEKAEANTVAETVKTVTDESDRSRRRDRK